MTGEDTIHTQAMDYIHRPLSLLRVSDQTSVYFSTHFLSLHVAWPHSVVQVDMYSVIVCLSSVPRTVLAQILHT